MAVAEVLAAEKLPPTATPAQQRALETFAEAYQAYSSYEKAGGGVAASVRYFRLGDRAKVTYNFDPLCDVTRTAPSTVMVTSHDVTEGLGILLAAHGFVRKFGPPPRGPLERVVQEVLPRPRQ